MLDCVPREAGAEGRPGKLLVTDPGEDRVRTLYSGQYGGVDVAPTQG